MSDTPPLTLRVKRLHPAAKLPTRGTIGSAGLDLYATDEVHLPLGVVAKVRTGLAIEIPPGFVGIVTGRSGLTSAGIDVLPGVLPGVLDSDYRGEVMVMMRDTRWRTAIPADKPIAQLLILPVPSVELVEVDELGETERNTGGFGSTDIKRDSQS